MNAPGYALRRGPTLVELRKPARIDGADFEHEWLYLLTDASLAEQLPFFGGRKLSRAAIMTLTTADWADHYSQSAIYLRLNGLLPPTAKKPAQ